MSLKEFYKVLFVAAVILAVGTIAANGKQGAEDAIGITGMAVLVCLVCEFYKSVLRLVRHIRRRPDRRKD